MTIAAVPAAGIDARLPEPAGAEPVAEGFDLALADAQAAAPKARGVERAPGRKDERKHEAGPIDADADGPVAEPEAEPVEPTDAATIAPLALPVVILPVLVREVIVAPVVETPVAVEDIET